MDLFGILKEHLFYVASNGKSGKSPKKPMGTVSTCKSVPIHQIFKNSEPTLTLSG